MDHRRAGGRNATPSPTGGGRAQPPWPGRPDPPPFCLQRNEFHYGASVLCFPRRKVCRNGRDGDARRSRHDKLLALAGEAAGLERCEPAQATFDRMIGLEPAPSPELIADTFILQGALAGRPETLTRFWADKGGERGNLADLIAGCSPK